MAKRQTALSIVLIFLLLSFAKGGEYFYDQIKIKRISTDFNGSVNCGNTLLVYGKGGVILRSTDYGSNWEQINLNDSLNIVDLVCSDQSLSGISSNRYIIYSAYGGVSWTAKGLEMFTSKATIGPS